MKGYVSDAGEETRGLFQIYVVGRWQRVSLQTHPLSTKPNPLLLTTWHCLSEFSSRKTEDINVAAISNQAHPPKCNTSNNLLQIKWNFSYGMASVFAKVPRPCGNSMERDQVSFMPAPQPKVPATVPAVSDKLNSVCWMNGWVLWHLVICKVLHPSFYLIFQKALEHKWKLISSSAFNRG